MIARRIADGVPKRTFIRTGPTSLTGNPARSGVAEHTDEILTEFGFTPSEIKQFRDNKSVE